MHCKKNFWCAAKLYWNPFTNPWDTGARGERQRVFWSQIVGISKKHKIRQTRHISSFRVPYTPNLPRLQSLLYILFTLFLGYYKTGKGGQEGKFAHCKRSDGILFLKERLEFQQASIDYMSINKPRTIFSNSIWYLSLTPRLSYSCRQSATTPRLRIWVIAWSIRPL